MVASAPDYYARYDQLMAAFSDNEACGMELFHLPSNMSREEMLTQLGTQGTQVWQDNLEILDEIESIENLPQQLLERTRIMRNYCRLRLSTLELITLSIKEQTDRYDLDITEQNAAMEALLDQLGEE